jgi:integrating conjugative element protein (TIGR03749 family)
MIGEERVVLVDRNVRVGVPESLGERLRVQTTGGAVYLRATAPIETTRLQLQDVETGATLLLDVTAEASTSPHTPFAPIRIVDATAEDFSAGQLSTTDANPPTPIPVVLTRYAAQSLYAPLRTVASVQGIARVPVAPDLALDTLLPTLPVRARPLAAWRLNDVWVTALLLTHTEPRWLDLDPRELQGDFVAATFQHPDLGPAGESTDTTVLYLVTQGGGLADALLPAVSPVDASTNLPPRARQEADR